MTDTGTPEPQRDPTAAPVRAEEPAYRQDPDAVLEALGTGAEGLSREEAARRLERDGANELRSAPPVPWWRRVLAQFQDPLVYLLLVAILISIGAWMAQGAAGAPIDAIVIAVIVILNAVIGLVQEVKAEDAVAALSSMTAASSTVLREGREEVVPTRELVVGDILVLAEGDGVGADARLLSQASLRIQEASLTGESVAVSKDPARIDDEVALGDRRNVVFKGTDVVQGVGRAVVTATGMDTEVGAIAELLSTTESAESPLTREITSVSKTLGILVIGIAVVVMAALWLVNGVETAQDAVDILLTGVSLAVAAVPEGLPAILSLVLAIGVRALAAENAVMKDLDSVETLGSASVIASDKTGTLTRNEMTLVRVVTASGVLALDGTGYTPEGDARVIDGDAELVEREARAVLVGGSLANNANLYRENDDWRVTGDPTEAAFLVALEKLPDASEAAERFGREAEVPFTSERKMMSVLGTADGERLVFSKGAPDVLLGHCEFALVGEAVEPLDDDRRAAILHDVEQMSDDAYRTLGVAFRRAEAELVAEEFDEAREERLVFAGVVGIIDPPREEVRDAVGAAHRAGIRTIMITGDHPRTASRIARDLGITSPSDSRALTGLELDEMSGEECNEAVAEVNVYARVAPENKLQIVRALQEDDHVVAMTGDGVNDAPALKTSDIGVAMGITGTEVTKQSATLVLGDDNYGTIVTAVHRGRIVYDNIRKFLRYLLSSNMGEVVTVFFGVVLAGVLGFADGSGGVVVPLLATQILWINLVTDTGPALAMGVDPEIDDVMARPPRDPKARILDAAMWERIFFIGVVMGAVTLLTMDMFLPGGLIEGNDSVEVARTAAFTTLVFAQLFNAFNARSQQESAFRRLWDNPWLWGAVVLAVVLQIAIVEIPVLQAAFSTAHLDVRHWLIAVAMASIVLWAEELAKLARRAIAGRREPVSPGG